jgi:hypothetical protein
MIDLVIKITLISLISFYLSIQYGLDLNERLTNHLTQIEEQTK